MGPRGEIINFGGVEGRACRMVIIRDHAAVQKKFVIHWIRTCQSVSQSVSRQSVSRQSVSQSVSRSVCERVVAV